MKEMETMTKRVDWKEWPDGQYDQPCCYCGRVIPAGRPRMVATRFTNPMTTATIKHRSCRPVVRFNSRGVELRVPVRGQEVRG